MVKCAREGCENELEPCRRTNRFCGPECESKSHNASRYSSHREKASVFLGACGISLKNACAKYGIKPEQVHRLRNKDASQTPSFVMLSREVWYREPEFAEWAVKLKCSRACVRCHEPIPTTRGWRATYCTTECRVKDTNQRRRVAYPRIDRSVPIECRWCGDAVDGKDTEGRLPVYCSPRCRERCGSKQKRSRNPSLYKSIHERHRGTARYLIGHSRRAAAYRNNRNGLEVWASIRHITKTIGEKLNAND